MSYSISAAVRRFFCPKWRRIRRSVPPTARTEHRFVAGADFSNMRCRRFDERPRVSLSCTYIIGVVRVVRKPKKWVVCRARRRRRCFGSKHGRALRSRSNELNDQKQVRCAYSFWKIPKYFTDDMTKNGVDDDDDGRGRDAKYDFGKHEPTGYLRLLHGNESVYRRNYWSGNGRRVHGGYHSVG